MVYSHCHAHSTHCYISIAEIYHCDDVSVYVMHIVYTLFTHCLHIVYTRKFPVLRVLAVVYILA